MHYGRTDPRTDKASYRDAWTHLKTRWYSETDCVKMGTLLVSVNVWSRNLLPLRQAFKLYGTSFPPGFLSPNRLQRRKSMTERNPLKYRINNNNNYSKNNLSSKFSRIPSSYSILCWRSRHVFIPPAKWIWSESNFGIKWTPSSLKAFFTFALWSVSY